MADQPLKAKYADVLIRPRITEKASFLTEKNVYTFEVAESADKAMVAAAVKAFYGVTALKVRMVNTPSKQVFVRGKKGTKAGARKAYVYLKKGDKIED